MMPHNELWQLIRSAGTDAVSLHNHSNFSDGASSLEEMCRAAKAEGFKLFGISDHWVCRPWENDEEVWWLLPEKLSAYIGELQQLQAELNDDTFRLLIGLEVDFFFENCDSVLAELAGYPVDYLIGSVHYAGEFAIDYDISDWKDLTVAGKQDICRIYWEKLTGAAERKEFAFLGHLDLPKKYALIDNRMYYGEARRVLDKLAANGGGIELNTAGWYKECQEQYPALPLLEYAAACRIPLVISADAHHFSHVKRDFERALDITKRAGY